MQDDGWQEQDDDWQDWGAEVEEAERWENNFISQYRNISIPVVFRDEEQSQGALLTESTRADRGPFQLTFFDEGGFTSDFCGDKAACLKECCRQLERPVELPLGTFEKISSTSRFQKPALIHRYIHSWEDMDSSSAKQLRIEFAEKPTSRSRPEDIYCWLYKKAMERRHIKALPLADGFGTNIEEDQRFRLSSFVLRNREWQKLSEQERLQGMEAEPYLSKGILQMIARDARRESVR